MTHLTSTEDEPLSQSTSTSTSTSTSASVLQEKADGPAAVNTTVASEDEMLIAYLHQREVHCPVCKYDLRNLKHSECPECGRKLNLRVTAAEPSQGPFMLLIAALGISSGLGIPSLIFICFGALQVFAEGPVGALAGFSMIYFACSIPLMLILLANRPSFLKLEQQRQRVMAGGVALFTALLIFIDLCAIFGRM